MLSAKIRNAISSISVRLTLWSVLVFSVCLIGVLTAFYYIAKSYIFRAVDAAIMYELDEARILFRNKGYGPLPAHIIDEAEEYDSSRSYFRIFDNSGNVVAVSNLDAWKGLADVGTPPKKVKNEILFISESNEYVRTVAIPLSDNLYIEGGLKVNNELALLHLYQYALPLTGLIIVILAASSTYYTARGAMKRVDEMTTLANSISATQLSARLPVGPNNDELSRLSNTFNTLLARIESLVKGMKTVTDDIAHDLKIPITRMRSRAELSISSNKIDGDPISEAANTLEECDHLLNLLNSMLDISEVEAKLVKLKVEPLDLDNLLRTAIELFETLAEQKDITLVYSGVGEMFVEGDIAKLQRAFSNLIDNAIKYTTEGGKVSVKVVPSAPNAVMVVISDTGIGISEDELPLIFERFYRADISRSGVGNGLGLTMSKALIEAHEGQVSVESTQGEGTSVSVHLKMTLTHI